MPVTGFPQSLRDGVTASMFAKVRHDGTLDGVEFGTGRAPPLVELRRQVEPLITRYGNEVKYGIILIPTYQVARHGTSFPAVRECLSKVCRSHRTRCSLLVNSVAEATAAVNRITTIDRAGRWVRAIRRIDVGRTAEGCLAVYDTLVGGPAPLTASRFAAIHAAGRDACHRVRPWPRRGGAEDRKVGT